jgi:hypothetical protein
VKRQATRRTLLAGCVLSVVAALSAQTERPGSWLDRPLTNWNKPGEALPKAPPADETTAAVINRCRLTPSRATEAERAVGSAGWITFSYFEQKLMRDDVEIVAGMRSADGMCRPWEYNLFVFVGGRFAGQLAPAPMNSRLDGSSGAVRLPLPHITAEFARYTSDDPLCCPSAHVTVRYRIDRTTAGPVVVPIEVRTTRG